MSANISTTSTGNSSASSNVNEQTLAAMGYVITNEKEKTLEENAQKSLLAKMDMLDVLVRNTVKGKPERLTLYELHAAIGKHIDEKSRRSGVYYQEVVNGRCKKYIDYETYMPVGTTKAAAVVERRRVLDMFKEEFSGEEYVIIDGCREKERQIEDGTKVMLWCMSFHLVFQCDRFVDGADLLTHLKSIKLPFEIDESAYKAEGKQQLMRLPYCGKNETDRKYLSILDSNDRKMKFTEVTPELYMKALITEHDRIEEHRAELRFKLKNGLVRPNNEDIFSDSEPDDDEADGAVPVSLRSAVKQKEAAEKKKPAGGSPVATKQTPITEAYITELLECLLDDKLNQNMEWIHWRNVMWALVTTQLQTELDLLPIAHWFSSCSAKYDAAATQDIYNTSLCCDMPINDRLSIASIRDWAKAYNEDAYFEWREKWHKKTPEINLIDSPFTDGDIVDYFENKHKDEYKFTERQVFRFNGVYWEETTAQVIFKELDKLYFTLVKEINQHYKDNAERHGDCMGKILQLRRHNRQKTFFEAIQMRMRSVDDIFDMNGDLLGFINGTYELETGVFREGRVEDYISNVIPYDYAEVDCGLVMAFMDKVMPVAEERDFLLRLLSTGLRGKTVSKFVVLTGMGGNGKDSLMSVLMKATLGKHYYEANNSAITDELRGDLSVSINSMDKKRLVLYSEPKKVIKVNMMKHLTGSDNIPVRGLYSSKAETTLHGTHFMMCNKKPHLDEVSEAVARRLIVIPFRSLFRPADEIKRDYPDGQRYLFESNSFYESKKFGEDYKLMMMNVLLKYYKTYRDDAYQIKNIPKSIDDLAKEYLADCDEFYSWFVSRYEKSERPEDFIQVKDVFTAFKGSDFYNDLNKSVRRSFTLKRLIKEIQENPNLRLSYKDRHTHMKDGKRKEYRNALLKWRVKEYKNDEE